MENSHSKHAKLKKMEKERKEQNRIEEKRNVKGLVSQSLISRSRHREGNVMLVRDSLAD